MYYKIENKDCEVYKKLHDLRTREIFKKPVTDDGTKISATGLLCVIKEDNGYKLIDKVDWGKESQSELKTVFKNGQLIKEYSLSEIRNNINKC